MSVPPTDASRLVELEATNWLHTAILSAICNHLGREPSFALELSHQLTSVQARLESASVDEPVLETFIALRQGLGL